MAVFDPGIFDSDVFDTGDQPADDAGGSARRRYRPRPRVEEPLVEMFPPAAPRQIVRGSGSLLLRFTAASVGRVQNVEAIRGAGVFVLSSIHASGIGRQRLRASGSARVARVRAESSARQASRGAGAFSIRASASASGRQRLTGTGAITMRLRASGEGFEDGLLLQHVRELQDAAIIMGRDDFSGQLIVLEDQGWRDVHRSADEVLDDFIDAIKRAMSDGRTALNRDRLIAMLVSRDEREVFTLVSGAISTAANSLRTAFEDYLARVMDASGRRAVRRLKRTLRTTKRLRAAAEGDETLEEILLKFGFDSTNPAAVEWIKEHSAELVTDISEGSRERIKELVEEAFVEGVDVRDLADKIAEEIEDEGRAETIARTETMTASNAGQAEAWDQAVDAGLLTGDEKKEWIVTPDDRLCPICEPMDGVQVGLYEDFDVEGERIDQPPAHPNCRCTIALAVV